MLCAWDPVAHAATEPVGVLAWFPGEPVRQAYTAWVPVFSQEDDDLAAPWRHALTHADPTMAVEDMVTGLLESTPGLDAWRVTSPGLATPPANAARILDQVLAVEALRDLAEVTPAAAPPSRWGGR